MAMWRCGVLRTCQALFDPDSIPRRPNRARWRPDSSKTCAFSIEQANQVRHAGELVEFPAPRQHLAGLRLAVPRFDGAAELRLHLGVGHRVAGVPARELDLLLQLRPVR